MSSQTIVVLIITVIGLFAFLFTVWSLVCFVIIKFIFFVRKRRIRRIEEHFKLLEEQFKLKVLGGLSLDEQALMSARDRAWWLRVLDKREKESDDSRNS